MLKDFFFRWLFFLLGVFISLPTGFAAGYVPVKKHSVNELKRSSLVFDNIDHDEFSNYLLDVSEEFEDDDNHNEEDGDDQDFHFSPSHFIEVSFIGLQRNVDFLFFLKSGIAKTQKRFLVLRNLRL